MTPKTKSELVAIFEEARALSFNESFLPARFPYRTDDERQKCLNTIRKEIVRLETLEPLPVIVEQIQHLRIESTILTHAGVKLVS